VKQAKILFLITFCLLSLVLASCVPGGAQPAQGWAGTASNDGVLYVGTRDGNVVAVNSSNGDVEWSHTITIPSSGMSCGQTSAPAAIYSTPVVDGDMVYIGSYSGKVLALNTLARSQDLLFPQKRYGEWEWDCPRTNKGSNAIVADLAMSEDAIYVTSSNGKVYSLDKEFGDSNWKEPPVLDAKLWTSPLIQGDTIYVSTFDGHIHTLSAETGDLLPWAFESEVGFVSSPVIYEDTIFVGSFDNNLCAIRIGDSEPLWRFPGGKWFWAAPVVNEGVVYAGCLDGKIYAINAGTGEELWGFDAGGPIVSSPILVDNLLIVATESGNLYVIDPETGDGERIKNPENGNRPTINAQIRASLFAHEGMVYIHAQDDHLYSVDIEQRKIGEPFPLTIKAES